MMQNSAVVKDVSTATLLASTGAYKGQPGFANDAGFGSGLEYFWDTAGTPAWKLASRWQMLAKLRTPVLAPNDTNENILWSFVLPRLGANDILLVEAFYTLTGSTNNKTLRIQLGTTGSFSTVHQHQVNTAAQSSDNIHVKGRNMNATNSQYWITNNTSVWGAASGTLQTSTKELGTAGQTLQLTATKVLNTETVQLEYADIWVYGGG